MNLTIFCLSRLFQQATMDVGFGRGRRLRQYRGTAAPWHERGMLSSLLVPVALKIPNDAEVRSRLLWAH